MTSSNTDPLPAILEMDETAPEGSSVVHRRLDAVKRTLSGLGGCEGDLQIGWFAFADPELEREFLEVNWRTWRPRLKLVAGALFLWWLLFSLAWFFNWADFLGISSGRLYETSDILQTHIPPCMALVFNLVLRAPCLCNCRTFMPITSAFMACTAILVVAPTLIAHRSTALERAALDVGEMHPHLMDCDVAPEQRAAQFAGLLTDASKLWMNHCALVGSCIVLINLLPCGPFNPLASPLLAVLCTGLFVAKDQVHARLQFGGAGPKPLELWHVYAALNLIGCLVSFSRWHLARRLFLLKLGAEARAEQLLTEKERIDYERRFALRELERRASPSSAAATATSPPASGGGGGGGSFGLGPLIKTALAQLSSAGSALEAHGAGAMPVEATAEALPGDTVLGDGIRVDFVGTAADAAAESRRAAPAHVRRLTLASVMRPPREASCALSSVGGGGAASSTRVEVCSSAASSSSACSSSSSTWPEPSAEAAGRACYPLRHQSS